MMNYQLDHSPVTRQSHSFWPALGLVPVVMVFFCRSHFFPVDQPAVSAQLEVSRRPPETMIQSRVDSHGNVVVRSILKCPAGDCLIEHYLRAPTDISRFSEYRQDDSGEVVFVTGNRWYAGQDAGSCAATFNCGTFAVGDYLGLTPADWLHPESSQDGFPTPVAVILDSFFDPVCEMSVTEALNPLLFEADSRLRDGDVLCFEKIPRDGDPSRRIMTHVARIQKKDGVNRLLSKFGEGPVVLSDIKFAHRMFPGGEVVKVYRFDQVNEMDRGTKIVR